MQTNIFLGNQVEFTVDKLDDLKSADRSGFCMAIGPNYLDVSCNSQKKKSGNF